MGFEAPPACVELRASAQLVFALWPAAKGSEREFIKIINSLLCQTLSLPSHWLALRLALDWIRVEFNRMLLAALGARRRFVLPERLQFCLLSRATLVRVSILANADGLLLLGAAHAKQANFRIPQLELIVKLPPAEWGGRTRRPPW